MMNLFEMGGTLFMSLLTLALIGMLTTAFFTGIRSVKAVPSKSGQLRLIKEVGLFALILGILGQFIGLYAAFEAIEIAGDVPPTLLAAGLKVSSITTIYGLLIYLLSLLIYFGLNWKINRAETVI
ncbi:MAG: MotA/TolQ/ExbB proton channel family protein [Cyclobacteriaceae bacterium]|nr:MotA/TolQ/ExbB proton channel family protein [Cyclobacteriaceae bacterium]MCH8517222.1 MotA/TolQ/ExbB proton channel family protein [Cyclobacteriaceae bacterium]